MQLKFLLPLFFSFYSLSVYAQQADLQSKRPLVFTKPVPLNWKSIPFESINYSETSIDGGASIFSLSDQSSLTFSVRIVLPENIYSLTPEERTTYGALNDLLILGGFGDLTFEQIQNTLSVNGINLETTINQNGQIVISAKALTSDFDLVLSLIQDLVFHPKFDNAALDIWKQENGDMFTNLMDANTLEKQMRLVDNQANILALGENHYFSNSIKRISPLAVNKVTNEKVKELYKHVINRNGLMVWLAGNYAPKNLTNLEKFISHIPKRAPSIHTWLPARSLTKNENNKILTVILQKKDMTQCNVTLRYYFPDLGKLNDIEKTQFSLMSEIFSSTGGIIGNDRFTKVMRADSGISYSPYAYFNNNVLYPNTNLSAFYLNFQTPNERLTEAVNLAKQTWETFLAKGITQEELDISRTALMNRLLASEFTIFNKSDEIMAEALKGKIPNKSPIEFSLVSLDQMRDVTRINSILNELMQKHPIPVLVIMGNPDSKQIAALTSEKQINLVKIVDFESFVRSF